MEKYTIKDLIKSELPESTGYVKFEVSFPSQVWSTWEIKEPDVEDILIVKDVIDMFFGGLSDDEEYNAKAAREKIRKIVSKWGEYDL